METESICEPIPVHAADVAVEKEVPDLPFNDEYDISTEYFISMMDKYVETVTDKQIETVERITRGQSDPETWRDLKRVKLTASNFHAASIRQKEPDNLLKNIMYIKATKSPKPLLQYGLQHEDDAVASYVAFQAAQGNTSLRVQKVGTIISKERPGLGASLDRMVYDPNAKGKRASVITGQASLFQGLP